MAGISDEDIQRVREASDLVALVGERTPVRQRGRDFWCCCPFHNEKTPSCKLDPSTQLWHCFGCGEGGDIFALVMKLEDLTFPEAVHRLAERAHIDIAETGGKPGIGSGRKARLKAVCAETADFYHFKLMRGREPEAAAARDYLSGRDLGGEVPKRWNLGFAPRGDMLVAHLSSKGFAPDEMIDANVAVKRNGKLFDRFFNRIMFPITDAQVEVIAFGGRVIGKGEPKYLNSQETPLFHKSRVLYGLDKAKAAMASTGIAIVVEGYTDVIALHKAGVQNVVATLGTALTRQHIRLLSRHISKSIVYLFDGDEAGQRAADKALAFVDDSITPEAGRTKIEITAVTLPNNLDPADFVEQQGGAALQELIGQAVPLLEYGIDRRLAKYDLSQFEGRTAALADALSILAPIKESLLARQYARYIALHVHARTEDVYRQLERLKPPRVYEEDQAVGATKAPGGGAQQDAGANAAETAQVQQFPQAELARRRSERALLCLCAQQPELALAHADALAQTQWHEPAHNLIAQSLLDTLASTPNALPAQLVTQAAQVLPAAASILTANVTVDSNDVALQAENLVEDLSLGDAEEAVAALKAQLSDPSSVSEDEYEMLFETVAAMQRDIAARRTKQKSLKA